MGIVGGNTVITVGTEHDKLVNDDDNDPCETGWTGSRIGWALLVVQTRPLPPRKLRVTCIAHAR